jgi:hypothetical protein
MLIGFLIPSYILILATYGFWLYCRIIFDELLFDHSDMAFYAWLAFVIYLHITSIRTLNTRYGYTETTFVHKNPWIQGILYATLMPIVILDWKWMKGFSLFLAQTWKKFWIVLLFVKLCAIGSIWGVIVGYMDYENYEQYIGWLGFSICVTALFLVKFTFFLDIYVWVMYLAPFGIYWVLFLILLPFMKCCQCASWWVGQHLKSDESYEYEEEVKDVKPYVRQTSADDIENDGGDEEELPGYGEGGNMATERSLEVRGNYGRGSRYEVGVDVDPNDATSAAVPNKKVKKVKKRGSRGCCCCKSSTKPKLSKEAQEEVIKEKRLKRVYKTPIEQLWFFARVWRALNNKYCSFCDWEMLSWQEEYVCDVGHIIHLTCAKVKWVGNKVCPLCVKQPATMPADWDPNYGKENAVEDEEVYSDAVPDVPMKPNAA